MYQIGKGNPISSSFGTMITALNSDSLKIKIVRHIYIIAFEVQPHNRYIYV